MVIKQATRSQAFAIGYHDFFEDACMRREEQIHIFNFQDVYSAWQSGYDAAKTVMDELEEDGDITE